MTHHVLRRYHLATHEIIGDIQQRANEDLVARDAFFLLGFAVGVFRHAFAHKAAFRTNGHDYRVFHLLRFNEAQHFGTEIFKTVRPAQAATRHFATAQVNAFDTRRADENLVGRTRLGHTRYFRRFKLVGNVILEAAIASFLVIVGAQRGLDQLHETAQQLVVIEAGNAFQVLVKAC